MDPLDYLVEDCWLHLFKFLSADDKQAMCDTCETFHAMLQPQKVEWGFELIVPHVAKYLFYCPWGYLEENRQLSFNLKCRLVCKSWRATFDKVCGSNRKCRCHNTIREKYAFGDSELEKFLNFFKDHQGNPFIGRRVTLFTGSSGEEYHNDIQESDENEEVLNEEQELLWQAEVNKYLKGRQETSLKNQELLMRYGQEIEHFTLYSGWMLEYERCKYELDDCKYLQIVLCNTPNLQSLNLSVCLCYVKLHEGTFQTALAEYFERNPLPEMPKLRELTLIQNNPKIETLLLEAYGEKLQILRMDNSSEILFSVWGKLKCLKKLSLRQSDFASNEKILRALHSPLEILSIYEKNQRGKPSGQFFMIDKFLLAVQHLPLKKVKVRPAWDIVKESSPFPADFPKHFTITEFVFQYIRTTSLNFAQFLPNLRKQVVGKNIWSFLSNQSNDSNPSCKQALPRTLYPDDDNEWLFIA